MRVWRDMYCRRNVIMVRMKRANLNMPVVLSWVRGWFSLGSKLGCVPFFSLKVIHIYFGLHKFTKSSFSNLDSSTRSPSLDSWFIQYTADTKQVKWSWTKLVCGFEWDYEIIFAVSLTHKPMQYLRPRCWEFLMQCLKLKEVEAKHSTSWEIVCSSSPFPWFPVYATFWCFRNITGEHILQAVSHCWSLSEHQRNCWWVSLYIPCFLPKDRWSNIPHDLP